MMKKKTILTLSLIFCSILLIAQDDCDCKECIFNVKNISTYYPAESILDYAPKKVFSRVAFPTSFDSTRVWLKGNNVFNKALIYDEENILISKDSIKLSPPFYTETISFKSGSKNALIHFYSSSKKIQVSKVAIYKKSDFISSDDNYSIMFYGCFQPFKVDSESKKPTLISSNENLNYHMRNYFKQVSLGEPIKHVNYLRNDKKPKNFYIKETNYSPLISSPKLIIGTGDQIYVDAGYKYEGEKGDSWEDIYKNHPISGWGYLCCDPTPLLTPKGYSKHLNKTYNAFNSFSSLDTIFKTLPSINIWDDHEIRDGWGSHGDEYDVNGDMNPKLSSYYSLSRQAFIQHQWEIGSQGSTIKNLSQIKSVNDFEIFAFDLRTNRNINNATVIGKSQMNQFVDWCNSIKDSSQVIIVSSIPFFYGNTIWSEKQALKLTDCELSDDLKDSWGYNFKERNQILSEIIKLRNRKVKPIIVSGDVHVGAMTEIWYEPLDYKNTKTKKSQVLCYELIASGLSHESLGEGQDYITRILRDKSENQRWNDPTIRLVEDSIQVYPSTRISRPDLNFGAIEKKNDSFYMHLYTTEKRKKKNYFIQNTLLMDWDKSIEEDEKLRFISFKQVLFNIFNWNSTTYTPAPVEFKKKIKID